MAFFIGLIFCQKDFVHISGNGYSNISFDIFVRNGPVKKYRPPRVIPKIAILL